jgi:hypothetical protein
MKITSAIFLVLLIAQSAFATKKNPLEFLQATPTGKQVYDTLLLEVVTQGSSLDSKAIIAKLTTLRNKITELKLTSQTQQKAHNKECKSDLKALGSVSGSLIKRVSNANRFIKALNAKAKVLKHQLARAEEETAHFKLFRGWANDNIKAWKGYYKFTVANLRKAEGWVASLINHLQKTSGSSFVELPADYVSNLSQIKTEFERTYDNLGGLRPIFANIFELIQEGANVKNAKFVQKALNILNNLSDKLGDGLREFAEENESQEALFDNLEKVFSDAVSNINRVTDALSAALKHVSKKIAFVSLSVKGASDSSNQSQALVAYRHKECQRLKNDSAELQTQTSKTLIAINEIVGFLLEDFAGLRSSLMEKLAEI